MQILAKRIQLRELAAMLAHAAAAFWTWLLAGLAQFLPDAWRNKFAFHPYKLVVASDRTSCNLVKRNLFGDIESESVQTISDGGSIEELVVAVPAELIHVARLNMPREAANDMRSALVFRMDGLTPFPVSKTVFDFRINERNADGRLGVDVAMTRENWIDGLDRTDITNARRIVFGAAIDHSGEPAFVFRRQTLHNGKSAGWVTPYTALIAGTLLLLLAIDIRLNRSLATHETVRAEALATLRDLTSQSQELTQLERAGERLDAFVKLSDLPRALNAVAVSAPDGFHVRAMTLDNRTLRIDALAATPDPKLVLGEDDDALIMRTVESAPAVERPGYHHVVVQHDIR